MIINQISKGKGVAETYVGETVVTPIKQTTVLETAGKYMEDDITVEPIPNEYGLITFTAAIPSAAIIMVS